MTDDGSSVADAVAAAHDLKARYLALMDARRWDEWASLFAEDATLDAREDMPFHGVPPEHGLVHGRERIVAGSRRALEGTTSHHRASAIAVEVVDADRIRASWEMTDRIEHPDGRVLEGAGTYHDEYTWIDGRWQIQHVRLARSSLEWQDGPAG